MKLLRLFGVLVVLGGIALILTVAPARLGLAEGRTPAAATHVEQAAMMALPGSGSRIGVSVRNVDPADLSQLKLPSAAGVVVEDLTAGSPAAKAGLKAGDVIVEFDGETVRSDRQFVRLVEESVSGRPVKVVIVRDGRKTTQQVTPEAASERWFDSEAFARSFDRLQQLGRHLPMDLRAFGSEMGGGGRLGVTVADMTPALAKFFGAPGGVLVTGIEPDSPAVAAKLAVGDVITTVGGHEVNGQWELARRLETVGAGDLSVEIVRDHKVSTVTVEIKARHSKRE